jgi:serine/threonine-protein kinase
MMSSLLKALGWLVYAGVLLVVFSISGYFAFNLFVRSGVTAVPSLEGLPRESAAALLQDHGLELVVREEPRYDEDVPRGHVLLQSPKGGSLVKRGSNVEIVTSLGQELIQVPQLEGQALQAAQVTLSAVGLTLGRTLGVYSRTGQPGTVVTQSPPTGTLAGRGESIDLYLSLEGRDDTVLMPDLAYRRYSEVTAYFEQRGFRIGSVKFEAYEGIAPGTVLRQHPLPGHRLRRHDVVSMVVTTTETESPDGTLPGSF